MHAHRNGLLAGLFLVLGPFIASAQSFSVSPNPVATETTLDGNGGPIDILAETTLSNNTGEILDLHWERITNNKPPCWETSVADINIAYVPWVDESSFSMAPNAQFQLLVFAYPNYSGSGPYAGEAEVVLKVTNLNDTTESVLVSYFITLNGDVTCVTSVGETSETPVLLYPNPTSGEFRLTTDLKYDRVLIYDIRGKEVTQFGASIGPTYNVSDLPKGIYSVQLVSQDGQITEPSRLLKH